MSSVLQYVPALGAAFVAGVVTVGVLMFLLWEVIVGIAFPEDEK